MEHVNNDDSGDEIGAERPQNDWIPTARPLEPVPAGTFFRARDELLLVASSPGDALVDILLLAGILATVELVMFRFGGLVISGLEEALPADDANLTRRLLLPTIGLRALFAFAAVAVILGVRRQSPGSIGLRARGLNVDVLIGIAVTMIAYGLITAVTVGVWYAWPGAGRQLQENVEILRNLVPRLSVSGYILLSLLVGVYEEVLFRGFLMVRLRRATGSWIAAVLVSTAIFTGLHAADQTPVALIVIAILSLLLSVSVILRRSLVPAIVAHVLFNLSQFLLLAAE